MEGRKKYMVEERGGRHGRVRDEGVEEGGVEW